MGTTPARRGRAEPPPGLAGALVATVGSAQSQAGSGSSTQMSLTAQPLHFFKGSLYVASSSTIMLLTFPISK